MGGGLKCSVPKCSGSNRKGVSLFRFPSNAALKRKWLEAIGRSTWTPYAGARVCELHFTPLQWDKRKMKLLPEVVPVCQPLHVCRCEKSPSLLEHSYASFHNPECQVIHRNSSTIPQATQDIQDILLENCKLIKKARELKEQQKENLKRKKKFTTEDVREGLQIRFACGSRGYQRVLKSQNSSGSPPLPSIRKLQLATAHIKFAPGILEEVLEPLKCKFSGFQDIRDKDINLVFDELVTKKQIDYDSSLKRFLGYGTLPGQQSLLAEKCEIYVFRGIRQNLKQVVCYHLNPSVVAVEEKKNLIIQLLQRAKDMGANVVAIVCDMGNRGLLSAPGFCTRKDSLKWCIPNPVNPDVKLWCVPDPVHVFKSMKECLCANRYIQLHQRVVAEYGLPSDMVDIEHIEWLEKFQRDDSLQLVPGLTLKDLSSTHFSKMKVKSSLKVINPRTSAALKYLVVKGLVPEAFETTAWFLKVMNRWFQLMSSRNPQCALGLRKEEVHTQALEHLRLVISVFKFMEIPGGWKPVQSHVIFATEAILEIENHLINQKKYEFLKTGTFTTDVVENINSCIRIRNPNPTPLECKTRLKHIAISQFQMKINSSSYNYDGAEDYVDLLVQSNSSSHSDPQHDFDFSSLKWIGCVPDNRKSHEDDVCYRICGYVVISLNRRRILLCKDCIQKLRHSKETPHPHSLFLMLTDFIPGAQFPVINEVFQLLRLIEHNLIVWLPKIRHLERLDLLIESIVLPATAPFHLPTCHSVKDKLVRAFTVMRFRQLALSDLSPTEKNSSSSLASKTAGGHYLAHNYRRPTSQITPQRKQPAASLKRIIKVP